MRVIIPKGDITLVQWRHSEDEINGIADYIRHLISDRGFPAEDILVLSPRRRLAYKMRDSLREDNIAVHSFYREEALEDRDAQRSMALLTLLCNPDDRVALRWWLGKDSASWLSGQYARLWAVCENENASPRQVLEAVVSGEMSVTGISRLKKSYIDLRTNLEERRGVDLRDLVDDLFPLGHAGCGPLRDVADSVLSRCEGVDDLLDQLRDFVAQPEAPEGDFVRIMSLQKAKGLTSRIVVVTSAIEGLIPNLDSELTPSEQKSSIEEQRRLFYVAVTRCTDVLVMSSFGRTTTAEAMQLGAVTGAGGRTATSRYIDELGPTAPRMESGRVWKDRGFISAP